MKVFLMLLALAGLWSCGEEDADLPADVLPQKKMQVVLWDMVKADELASYEHGVDTTINKKARSIELYNEVLRIHKITEQDFKRSMTFYQQHPKELKVVLDSLRTISERPMPYGRSAKSIN